MSNLLEKVGDPKLQENLESEISIMRDHQHPNIGMQYGDSLQIVPFFNLMPSSSVRLYEHFNSARYIYLIIELCPGGDLSKYIKRLGHVDEKTSRGFLRQLSDVLYFLNQKDLIHRDLKPTNVLLSEASDCAILKVYNFSGAVKNTKAHYLHCLTLLLLSNCTAGRLWICKTLGCSGIGEDGLWYLTVHGTAAAFSCLVPISSQPLL